MHLSLSKDKKHRCDKSVLCIFSLSETIYYHGERTIQDTWNRKRKDTTCSIRRSLLSD